MIITMSVDAGKDEIENVKQKVRELGYDIKVFTGKKKSVIHVMGVTEREKLTSAIEQLPGVENMVPILKPFKLASREFHPDDTIVPVNGKSLGGNNFAVIAGPCAVESREGLLEIAKLVREAGAGFLRGGAFKPRTSPYSFQGLGEEGLKYLAEARDYTGLSIVTEVLSEVDVPLVVRYADVLQIGSRNMQNFPLLKAVGRMDKPVLLKRGMSATIEDWLMSAEYILSEGNSRVILCERGIRTFENYTRNTLDISAVPVVKHLSHLPVIIDPSHSSGNWRYVESLSRAALAAGADGLIVEVHNNPSSALSDGKQSLKPEKFKNLMKDMNSIAESMSIKI